MPNLELTFKCLCFFTADPAARIVYVLMPSTRAHGGHADGGEHGGTGGHHPDSHVIRLLHPTRIAREGLDLKGWQLSLGPQDANADTSLQPAIPAFWGEQIVDLTPVCQGRLIDRRLVTGRADEISARVVLRGGGLLNLHAEAEWRLGQKRIAMATRATWKLDMDEALEWSSIGATSDPPLPSLAGFADPDGTVRLTITHETEASLLSGQRILSERAIQEHFRAFLHLYGITEPGADQLPAEPWFWRKWEFSGRGREQMESHPERHDGAKDFRYGCPTSKGTLAPA